MMQPALNEPVVSAARPLPHYWTRLIQKLRSIGLEKEAKKLELALKTLPPDEKCSVSFGPFSTD
jgi:hypothetical protein